mmetsp:Transcript_786/g.1710  ORF Transcript_786/g.1710 Transcript_786/m.1710 type:complete len:209 (+) Transcript_786:77-703(+)
MRPTHTYFRTAPPIHSNPINNLTRPQNRNPQRRRRQQTKINEQRNKKTSTMGEPAADLDQEIGIPPEATLNIPSQLPKPLQLLLTSTADNIIPSIVTVASSPSSPTLDDDDDKRLPPGTTGSSRLLSTARVSSESSTRGNVARSLIVGRQASAADIRIDHKSVSRRHTALYYKHDHHQHHHHQEETTTTSTSSSSSSLVMPVLVVRDP